MNAYETIDFKVGNTTFDSMFQINMPFNYGEAVPECHTHCPITTFFYASVSDIVNYINRGLRVNLKDDSDAEKIFFFLTEYNKMASKYNKDLGEEANPLALEAEKFFLTKLKHIIKLTEEKDDLAKRNPFLFTPAPKPKRSNGNVYRSNAIQSTIKAFNANRKKGLQQKADTRAPEEHKMYEIFNSPSLVAPDGKVVVNSALEPYIDTTPPDIDEMAFGVD